MDALNFTDLFNGYYLKTFHQIDMGKILRCEIKPTLNFLQQFTTVLNDSQKEAFRTGYAIVLENEGYFGILNRIMFNGPRAMVELIIL